MSGKIINTPIFPNQDWDRDVHKHNKFPVYVTDEFDFFRCVEFNPSLYGKSVFDLNEGNLRLSNANNRYSALFPKQKLSYWADSIDTARKEIQRHGSSNNIITFWSYDNAASTFVITTLVVTFFSPINRGNLIVYALFLAFQFLRLILASFY